MNTKQLVQQALQLKPAEKLHLLEALAQSIEQQDPRITAAWEKEAQARVAAYKKGKLRTIPATKLFKTA